MSLNLEHVSVGGILPGAICPPLGKSKVASIDREAKIRRKQTVSLETGPWR